MPSIGFMVKTQYCNGSLGKILALPEHEGFNRKNRCDQ